MIASGKNGYLFPFVYMEEVWAIHTHNTDNTCLSRTLILTGNYCGLSSEFIVMGA